MALSRIREVFREDSFNYILEVDFRIDAYRDYLRLTEQIIEDELSAKIKEYKKFLRDASEEMVEAAYPYEDHKIKIETHKLYYSSLLISIYAFFEKKLFQLCKIGEKKKQINVRDLGGEGIFKYNMYLKKVLLLDLEGLNSIWSEIIKFNKLRNHLVHNPENVLKKTNENLKKVSTFKSINNLSITEDEFHFEFAITDKTILQEFLVLINKYLQGIYYQKLR